MRNLFTSESVSEGHPDKVCDQISDALLDALLMQDKTSRVACETFVTTGMVRRRRNHYQGIYRSPRDRPQCYSRYRLYKSRSRV